jgi:hypothetical protein
MRAYLAQKKNPHTKRAGGVAQGIGPDFKPQYYKKTKKPQKTRVGVGCGGTKLSFQVLRR